jgi:hypothetical protein
VAGTPDACEVSICAFKSLRQLDNIAWHSARRQNDVHSGESADDLTEIEAEIVLEATGNTSTIVRLLLPFAGRLATSGRSPVAWTAALKCFLPKMPSFRPCAVTSAMDCVKALIR